MTMNINTNDITGCHPGAQKRIVRMRATKVRYQCSDCLRIGPWEKQSGTQAAQVMTSHFDNDLLASSLGALTVGELRDKAKASGLTGYSKMKKDDLITAIIEKGF